MSAQGYYVVIVTARPDGQNNVLKTVAAYVTNEPYRAAELRDQAERETGGTACINFAPFVRVPECDFWAPMEEVSDEH